MTLASTPRPVASPATARPWLRNRLLQDLIFVVAIAGVAAALRIVNLSGLPDGFHGDEALTGLDAQRILDGHSIFPYTASAKGQPAGPMYAAALWVKLLGPTVTAVRLPMAILGVGTVVLAFFAFRELFGREVAYAGGVILAFSSWLIFFNRTGFTVSAMPFTEMASLLAVALALKRGTWAWFVVAGGVVGLGVYGYFSYPLFAAGLAIWLLMYAAIERPRPFLLFTRKGAVMGLTALLVIAPMWPYVNSDKKGYQHDRALFTISHTPAYQAAGASGKLELYWDNAKRVLNSLREGGHPEGTDGSGDVAAMDPLLLVTAMAGLVVCLSLAIRRRRAAYLLPLVIIPIVLVGPIESNGGAQRRALGILPFVALAAAILIGALWKWFIERNRRLLAVLVVAPLLASFAAINVYRYYASVPDTRNMLFVFSPELADVSEIMNQQPAGTRIYFASDRWAGSYEAIRYLVPDATAESRIEDRSTRFGKTTGYDGIDRAAGALVVLLDDYIQDADAVSSRYPDAVERLGRARAKGPTYVIFQIPPG